MRYTIVSVLILSLPIILILTFIDNYNGSKYWNKLIYKNDCSFVVPKPFKVMHSERAQKYVVATGDWEDEYLRTGTRGIVPMFSYIAAVSVFDDSCAAKGYLKAYLDQITKLSVRRISKDYK